MQRQNDVIIEQILKQRVSRGVDRVFSENRHQKIVEIYNTLQSKIKLNTYELRQALYRKYENLINCSDLLDDLHIFSSQMNKISQQMSKIIKDTRYEQQQQLSQQSKINTIEKYLNNNKFSIAMQKSIEYQHLKQDEIACEQKFYLKFIKIEILDKLQQFLRENKFTKNIIQQYLTTINIFLNSIELDQFQEMINDKESILGILSDNISAYRQKNSHNDKQTILVEVLFSYKLTTLSLCQSQQQIYRFFCDLVQLCKEDDNNKLKQLFEANSEEMKVNLVHIFIKSDPSGLIFKIELYEQLLKSQQIMNILTQLEKVLGLRKQIVDYFIKLWQDYYKQLIDILIEQLTPLKHCQSLTSNKQQISALPKQFHKFIVDKSLTQTYQIRKQYQNIIQKVNRNLKLLCEKGQIKSIMEYYEKKIKQTNNSLKMYLEKQYESQINKLSLRKIILINLMCEDYNRECIEIQAQWKNYPLNSYDNFDIISNLFNKSTKTLEDNMLQMDKFFSGYTIPYLKTRDLRLVQNFIINILQSIKNHKQPKQQDRIEGTCKRLLNQQYQISIYKFLLPTIGRYIFLRNFNAHQLKLDERLYGKYIPQKVDNKFQMIDNGDDNDFDIGQKDNNIDINYDMVKGSIKSMGNFISGFMPKRKM